MKSWIFAFGLASLLSGCARAGAPPPGGSSSSQDLSSSYVPVTDATVAPMVSSASPTINQFVARMACTPRGMVGNLVAQYLDSSVWLNQVIGPETGMPLTRLPCVSVARIGDWRFKAKNAFSFIVVYQATDSGEGARQGYTAINQPNGAWLFKVN